MRARLLASLKGFQRNRCYLCGGPLRDQKDSHKSEKAWWRTIDHIVPQCAGGPNRVGNCALAHYFCNIEKGDRMPTPCEVFYGAAIKDVIHREHIDWRRKWGSL